MSTPYQSIPPPKVRPLNYSSSELDQLAQKIKQWGVELGFQQIGISDIDLTAHEDYLETWLAKNYHGEMSYMAAHGTKRSRPAELVPGTLSVITARMDYLPTDKGEADVLLEPEVGYIARYALGKDYHKLMRKRLKKLAQKIQLEIGEFGYRVFTDSAPVLERALAEKSGLGWTGKNSLILNRYAGSYFFLGEIYIDIDLPADQATSDHCGSCTRCIDVCPTQAIVSPKEVDARRCISYLTIESQGAIPEQFRSAMGNRIYGCDDCQIFCPWNRYAELTHEKGFLPRHQLDRPKLIELWHWNETEFLSNMEGSAIRRIGYHRWLRNISIALGNAHYDPAIIEALENKRTDPELPDFVDEHIQWAIQAQQSKSNQAQNT
ncbi:MAG: tRNA epoxyqueuosine(34) reductase QueG [Gammaproteobacteria bacterium]|nr:MAG: tRNA epoxyqueuosine(34) reductase QueG [Gammaproteobacteria bacterium]